MDEAKLIKNRLEDLSRRCDLLNICTYSQFLNPAQAALLSHHKNVRLFGGYDDAIYKIAAFFPYDEEEIEFPLSALKIVPNFAKRPLNHRDYLGSILGLGIKREVTGDILVHSDYAVLFCLSHVKDFILQNLRTVGSANVTVSEIPLSDAAACVEFEEICAFVASARLDSVLAAALKTSRSRAAEILRCGAVKLNYTEVSQGDKKVNERDILSVRGFGKFIFDGVCGTSKKDRLKIIIRKYI